METQVTLSLWQLIAFSGWIAAVVAWFLGGAYARRRKEGMTREQAWTDLGQTAQAKASTVREAVAKELADKRQELAGLEELWKRVGGGGDPPSPQ